MISWLWLIPTIFVSAFLGAAAIGIANAAGRADQCERCKRKGERKGAHHAN